MKKNWQTKKLGEVCEIITGGTPKTSVKDFYGNEFLWAGPSDLDQGVFITNTNKKLSKKGFRESGIRLIPKNSVLLSCIGNIGKIGIAIEEMATNQQINTFVPNLKILDSKYLYYVLIIKTEEFKLASSQTTLPIINKTRCSNIEIPLPSLLKQKEIVKYLDNKFAKLREVKQLQELALVDTEKILSQNLHEIFEDGKKKGWKEKTIGDITEVVTKGTTPKTFGESFTDSGVPFLKAENITGGPVDLEKLMTFISHKTNDLLNRSKTKSGDVLMTIAGTIGRVGYLIDNSPEMNTNQAVAIIRPQKNIISSAFLTYALQSPFIQKGIWSGVVKAAIPNFSLTRIKEIFMPIPPLSEQKQIIKKLDTLVEKLQTLKELQKQQLEDFKKLEKAYLLEAFNGELV